jgi:hypothetical protein
MLNKIFCHFINEQIWLCLFPRFQTPAQNFDYAHFEFELKTDKFNIAVTKDL